MVLYNHRKEHTNTDGQKGTHHIADIFPESPTALYPERATPAGLQFLIRWMF